MAESHVLRLDHEQNNKQNGASLYSTHDPTRREDAGVCVCTHSCHRWGGGWGGDNSWEQRGMISIKLDDAPTHSIDFDVKHKANVPDSISAPSSESYQRAGSVRTK